MMHAASRSSYLQRGAVVCLLTASLFAQSTAEDWRQKANELFRDRKYAEAIQAYDKSISLDPNNPKAYVGRGSSYKGLNQPAKAFENYNRAIALDPNYSNAYMNRAGLQYQTGNAQAALADYNRSIELDPNNAPAYYSRGLLHSRLGNTAAAAADLNRSLSIEPAGAYAANARNELAKLPVASTPPPAPAPAAAPAAPPAPAAAYSASIDRLAIPQAAFAKWPFPVQPAALPPLPAPPPGPPAYLPENLDINHIGPAAFDAAMRAAKEAVRLLRGPMSAEDEQRFELIWAPVFEYPCQPVAEYFNKLTPKLNSFLETRGALQRALITFNNAYEEAITAAGLQDDDAVREAMDVAGVHRNSVAALDIRLNQLAREIEALGDPPDPLTHRARARKLNEEAARFVKGPPSGGTYWVLIDAKADNNPKQSDGQWLFSHIVSEGFAKGSANHSWTRPGDTKPSRASALAELRWTPPPPLLPTNKTLDFEYSTPIHLSCANVEHPEILSGGEKSDCARIFLDPASNPENYASITPLQPARDGTIGIRTPSAGQFKTLVPFKLKVEIATPGGYTHFFYTYDLRQLTPEQVAAIRASAAQGAAGRAQSQAEAGAKSDEVLNAIFDAQTQKEAKLEAIAFAKENQKYFEAKRDEYRGAAINASPADRERYQYLAMVMDANLQAERDNQTTMETGQWTRTRTEYDDWNFQYMAAQSQAAARDYQKREEALAAIPRILALFPKELRDAERSEVLKTVGAAIAQGNTEGVQSTVNVLAEKSKQLWTKRGEMYQDQAQKADYALTYAEKVKTGAAIAAMAISVPVGATYLIGYMGVTGAIEGGLDGGLKGAVIGGTRGAISAVHPAAMVALSAYDGYQQAGLQGAAQGAVETAAMILLAQKVVAPILGKALSARPAPSPQKWPSVQEQIAESQHAARLAMGRAKAKLFQERVENVQLAGRNADPRLLADLNAKAVEAAKAIKCDQAAKMALNQMRANNPAVIKAFLRYDEQLMAEVQRDFQQGMARSGYSPLEIRSYTNSASAGKVGMDVDIGLVEPPRFIRAPNGAPMKNPVWETWHRNNVTRTPPGGKPEVIPISDYTRAGQQHLQTSFDKVYGGTGRPTSEGFVNFTSSAHGEAYVDPAWIGRRGVPHADFENIMPGSAKQAGEVTAFKVSHLTGASGAKPDYLKLQEACRTLVKDFNTKLIGSEGPAVLPAAPLAKATAPVQQQVLRLRDTMNRFARNEIGPLEADRAIRELTGGEGLPAAVRQYQSLLVSGSK